MKQRSKLTVEESTQTPDALAALKRINFSRRDFLKGAGSLIVSFSVVGVSGFMTSRAEAAHGLGVPGDQLDSWIAIGADGSVTAYTGKCELGQGIYTAQVQLIAEELGVAIHRVNLIQCDTALTPDQGTTSGSLSHPTNFNSTNLAQAAATAREALFRMASENLGVSVDKLEVNNGLISVISDSFKRVSYGELVGGDSSTFFWITRQSALVPMTGMSSANLSPVRKSQTLLPVASSLSTTCVCRECFTAKSSALPLSARNY